MIDIIYENVKILAGLYETRGELMGEIDERTRELRESREKIQTAIREIEKEYAIAEIEGQIDAAKTAIIQLWDTHADDVSSVTFEAIGTKIVRRKTKSVLIRNQEELAKRLDEIGLKDVVSLTFSKTKLRGLIEVGIINEDLATLSVASNISIYDLGGAKL